MMAKYETGGPYPLTVVQKGTKNPVFVVYNVCTGREHGEFSQSHDAWIRAVEVRAKLKSGERV